MIKYYYSPIPYKKVRIFKSVEEFGNDFQRFVNENPDIIHPVSNDRSSLKLLMISAQLNKLSK